MIDPKTLHIGSHVMVNGVRARVIRIDEPKDEHEMPPCTLLRFKALSNGKWYDCGCPADSGKVEPIPITAELLTELGFLKMEEHGSMSVWLTHNIRIDFDDTRIAAMVGNENDYTNRCTISPIHYLHELEAFLYLTTKTELIKE